MVASVPVSASPLWQALTSTPMPPLAELLHEALGIGVEGRAEQGDCAPIQEQPYPPAERRLRRRQRQRGAEPGRGGFRDDDRQPPQARHPGSFGSVMVRNRKASASISNNLPALSSPKPVMPRTASIAARLPTTPVSAPSTP
jgi:hypothetical protein